MIHPQLVEQVARGEDARIRRAAAVGLPDPSLGERLSVVCESDDDVTSGVESRLRNAEIIFDQLLTTSKPLPVDPRHNSKIDYPALRDMIMDGRVR
jgi:acyl-CoA synthetase (AMP-forming)/AMP-acid ligase II